MFGVTVGTNILINNSNPLPGSTLNAALTALLGEAAILVQQMTFMPGHGRCKSAPFCFLFAQIRLTPASLIFFFQKIFKG